MVVGAGLRAKHQLPQDDGEAEDVSLRRPGGGLQVLPEQLRGRPVELWADGRTDEVRRSCSPPRFLPPLLPLTAVICLLQGASGSAATSELPQTKAREFDLQPTVHQAGAELQVPVEPQVASVDELHPLKHRQGRGGEDGGGRSRWRSWRSNRFVCD